MKNLVCTFAYIMFFTSNIAAQVTIGSGDPPHPSAVLELRSADKGFLGPRISLTGISSPDPVEAPAVGLLIFNIADSGSGSDAVKAGRFYYWSGEQWIEFIQDSELYDSINETLEELGIPKSAVFHLDGKQIIDTQTPDMKGVIDLQKGLYIGESASVPLRETINETNGYVTLMTNDNLEEESFSLIKFKPGTYSILFAYQFIPADKAQLPEASTPDPCTISSFFMDFPPNREDFEGRDRIRIHNNSHHNQGTDSFHGNSISYVTRLDKETEWMVKLGVGQSGNCTDNDYRAIGGYAMSNDNTFLYISRMGD